MSNKWTCKKCSSINPQFSYRCHNCKHDLDDLTKAVQDHVEIRGTGKSTVIALETIAYAIGHPMQWHKVEDHFYSRDQREANRHLLGLIMDICHKMQYNIEVDSNRLRIRSLHLGYKVVNGIMQEKVKSDA